MGSDPAKPSLIGNTGVALVKVSLSLEMIINLPRNDLLLRQIKQNGETEKSRVVNNRKVKRNFLRTLPVGSKVKQAVRWKYSLKRRK